MAKSKLNGIFRQDAILSQFSRDAKSSTDNSAVAQAIRAGKRNAEYRAKKMAELANQPRMAPGYRI